MVIAIPYVEGSGSYLHTIKVEYEWKSPTCGSYLVFGHDDNLCPKRVVSDFGASLGANLGRQSGPSHMKNVADENDGFQVVQTCNTKGKQHVKSSGFKPKTFEYHHVSKPSGIGTSKKNGSEGKNGATTSKKDTNKNLVTLKNSFKALKDNDKIFETVDTSSARMLVIPSRMRRRPRKRVIMMLMLFLMRLFII